MNAAFTEYVSTHQADTDACILAATQPTTTVNDLIPSDRFLAWFRGTMTWATVLLAIDKGGLPDQVRAVSLVLQDLIGHWDVRAMPSFDLGNAGWTQGLEVLTAAGIAQQGDLSALTAMRTLATDTYGTPTQGDLDGVRAGITLQAEAEALRSRLMMASQAVQGAIDKARQDGTALPTWTELTAAWGASQ